MRFENESTSTVEGTEFTNAKDIILECDLDSYSKVRESIILRKNKNISSK